MLQDPIFNAVICCDSIETVRLTFSPVKQFFFVSDAAIEMVQSSTS